MISDIVIVTGYSGAGKTSVLKTLEDIDYFCVDNLPIALIPSFFEHAISAPHKHAKIALGIDVRSGSGIETLNNIFPELRKLVGSVRIFFLTATTQELLKRFQETRRKHPLASAMTLPDAIEQEKQLLKPLINIADLVVDTGNFTIHQLRHLVRTTFAPGEQPTMVVSLTSFGFKYGVPQECNYVYDIRSLPNPHFVESLRPLTGVDDGIKEFLFTQPEVQEYWQKFVSFFYFSLKKSYEEGRHFIQIAIGCTGGKHRSVAFVEELAKRKSDGVIFLVNHRDIKRDKEGGL